ncbi:hypothetical protein DL770_000167 [Monosporascus sp. CRB-9-2]|nr:hypothetical protein DL770_000167 [Monosporascus sp. CRB-9-2]
MDNSDSLDAAQGGAKRHGLFRLHPEPQNLYNHLDFDVDIVAIYGLGGHAFNTWTDKDGHLWLRDSLPARVPKRLSRCDAGPSLVTDHHVTTLGTAVRSDLIRTLQVSSTELETISRHATELLKALTIVSFYEQKPIGPALVVEPFSAILGKSSVIYPFGPSSMTLAEDNRQLLNELFCVDYKAAQLRPRQP